MADPQPRLGRGLAALLGKETDAPLPLAANEQLRRIPIESCRPNPKNPRRSFDTDDLDELAASIKTRGVLQPIVVRAAGAGNYEIIAGERRWRAAQRAGIHDVPVIVVEADDRLALELAIVENVQRADLNALEEARGYSSLLSEYKYSQAELADVIGKSRSHVANTLRLLKLPTEVLDLLRDGKLSAGHARALLAVPDPVEAAKQIVVKGLSVRQAEAMSDESRNEGRKAGHPSPAATVEADANVRALSRILTEQTGLSVSISRTGESGKVAIEFKSLEQFDYIFSKLNEW